VFVIITVIIFEKFWFFFLFFEYKIILKINLKKNNYICIVGNNITPNISRTCPVFYQSTLYLNKWTVWKYTRAGSTWKHDLLLVPLLIAQREIQLFFFACSIVSLNSKCFCLICVFRTCGILFLLAFPKCLN